jgi:hypothetical protein
MSEYVFLSASASDELTCLEGADATQESDEIQLVLRYSLYRGATNQTLKKGLNLVLFY